MAKRKVTKTRTAKKSVRKRAAKSISKKSRVAGGVGRKKKVKPKAKSKKTKSVVKKKSAPKKAARKAKSTPPSRVTKKAKLAAKPAPKRAKKAGKKATPQDKAPPTHSRISLQCGSTTIELVEDGKKVPKTTLTKKELREFKNMLLAKRRELVGDMQNLGNEAINSKNGGGGSSNVPLHMADVGSDNWEQEFTLGLIENEQALVREIDAALKRVQARTYGVCLATHTAINKARLRAKPWAKYCIEYARLRELGRVP